MRAEDLDELRSQGFDDLDILDATNMCAHLDHVNRVANGLGLKHRVDAGFSPYAAIPR